MDRVGQKSFVPPAAGARVGGPRAHPLLGIWAAVGEMVRVQGGGGRGLLYEPGQNRATMIRTWCILRDGTGTSWTKEYEEKRNTAKIRR